MKQTTTLLVEITHGKALPPDVTDVATQRLYSWLYSRGCEAGVTAKLFETVQKDKAYDLPQPKERA